VICKLRACKRIKPLYLSKPCLSDPPLCAERLKNKRSSLSKGGFVPLHCLEKGSGSLLSCRLVLAKTNTAIGIPKHSKGKSIH